MLQPDFNGTTKRITLAPGTRTLDLVALHSWWKLWVLAGNAECLIAFGAVGGDVPAIPLYLFSKNGWKIVPDAADHVLNVVGGVLETDDASDPFVDPAGAYKIRIYRQAPGIAIGYSSGSAVLPSDVTAIAAATLAAATAAGGIDSNMLKTNGHTIIGSGIPPTYANQPTPIDPGDPFRVEGT